MTGATADRIDRLARWFAGGGRTPVEALTPADTTLSRASLLRYGAVGAAAVFFRGIPSAGASNAVASTCRGGSLSACNREGQKSARAALSACNNAYNDQNDPFGMGRYACWVDSTYSRFEGRKECKASCPKPKKKPKTPTPPLGPAPPGPNPLPLPPPPPIPTCGHVDCVDNDVCCDAGREKVCCAICCSKLGGCGSSDDDCKPG